MIIVCHMCQTSIQFNTGSLKATHMTSQSSFLSTLLYFTLPIHILCSFLMFSVLFGFIYYQYLAVSNHPLIQSPNKSMIKFTLHSFYHMLILPLFLWEIFSFCLVFFFTLLYWLLSNIQI